MRYAPALTGFTLFATCVVAACGGDGRTSQRTAHAIALGPPPKAAQRACLKLHASIPVQCPTRWPRDGRSPGVEAQDLTRPRFPGYLLSLNEAGFATPDAGHVLLAGQPRAYVLSGRPGQRWSSGRAQADVRLGLPHRPRPPTRIVERTTVGPAPALVLQAPPYPAGGVHGGHVVILWNSGPHGYAVSLHFAGLTLRRRIDAAVAIARSSR